VHFPVIQLSTALDHDNLHQKKFPHDPPTPITGKPVNTTLQILQLQLFANAGAIRSPQWGGTNGHLALLLDDATYLACYFNTHAMMHFNKQQQQQQWSSHWPK
jgi:hypothetical protein